MSASFWICILFSGASVVYATPRVDLAQMMLQHYYDVFPICSFGQAVPVSIHLSLQRINFIETDEEMNSIWNMYLEWTDCNMKWNPEQYGNLTSLEVPLAKPVWKPDLTWLEMMDFQDSLNVILNKTRTIAQFNGTMSVSVPIIIGTFCSADTSMFPFDRLTCNLTFYSLLHDITELSLTSMYPLASLVEYSTDGLWNILSCNTTSGLFQVGLPPTQHAYVQYTLVMQRKPLYFIYFMVFPYLILVIVSLTVFLLPEECGEKVGLVTNQIVCLAVFMILLSGEIVNGTEKIPLMGIYFAFLFGIVCFVCVTTIFTCYLHSKSETGEEMSGWVKKFFVDKLAPAIILNSLHPQSDGLDEVKAIEIFGLQAVKSEWEVLSVVVDRLFLIFFSLLTIASTLAFAIIGALQY